MSTVDRMQFIGASEVPALLGVSPFQKPHHIQQAKVWGIVQQESTAMAHGRALEAPVLEWLAVSRGYDRSRLREQVHRLDDACQVLGATADAVYEGDSGPVVIEVKTTGIASRTPHRSWIGPDGNVILPDHVWVQVQTQIRVLKASAGVVVCAMGGNRFHVFDVAPVSEFGEGVVKVVREFWDRYIRTRPDVPPCADLAWLSHPDVVGLRALMNLRLRGHSGGNSNVQVLLDSLRDVITQKRELSKTLEALEKQQEAVLSALADHGAIQFNGSGLRGSLIDPQTGVEAGRITYVPSADQINRQAMKQDGVYEKYAVRTYRLQITLKQEAPETPEEPV